MFFGKKRVDIPVPFLYNQKKGGLRMLFRKKIPVSCDYCAYSAKAEDGARILCSKRGFVERKEKCSKFHYDPLKRIPLKPKALDFAKYDEEDFSL